MKQVVQSFKQNSLLIIELLEITIIVSSGAAPTVISVHWWKVPASIFLFSSKIQTQFDVEYFINNGDVSHFNNLFESCAIFKTFVYSRNSL